VLDDMKETTEEVGAISIPPGEDCTALGQLAIRRARRSAFAICAK
jgi:hypothetical protein